MCIGTIVIQPTDSMGLDFMEGVDGLGNEVDHKLTTGGVHRHPCFDVFLRRSVEVYRDGISVVVDGALVKSSDTARIGVERGIYDWDVHSSFVERLCGGNGGGIDEGFYLGGLHHGIHGV